MSLRIIGGRFRNRALKSPKGEQTRPTTAIMRKAVFDICQFEIEGARFLDLFAGSGLMGLEALSRGAMHATFVDSSRFAIACLHDNIQILNAAKEASVICADALKELKRFSTAKKQFDLIYIDPPYQLKSAQKQSSAAQIALVEIDRLDLCAPGGRVFLEEALPGEIDTDFPLETLEFIDTRKFGKSLLHQYRSKL